MTEDEVKLQHELTEIRRSAGARYPGYSDIYLTRTDTGTVIPTPFEILDVLTTTVRVDLPVMPPSAWRWPSPPPWPYNYNGAAVVTPPPAGNAGVSPPSTPTSFQAPEYGPVAVLVLGRLVGDVFSECQLRVQMLTRQVDDCKANEESLTKEVASLKGQIELMRNSIEKAKQEAIDAREETKTHIREREEANRQRTLTEAKLFSLENALGKKQVEELMKKGETI